MGIAVDSAGNAYVTGYTVSTDFPTANALFPTSGGPQDAFVTKLNPAGSALVYSTYLGGSGSDTGSAIAVDSSGNAYVTGSEFTNFPTANALFAANGGGIDAFVTKLNAAGSALVYSTYLGGSGRILPKALPRTLLATLTLPGLRAQPVFPLLTLFRRPLPAVRMASSPSSMPPDPLCSIPHSWAAAATTRTEPLPLTPRATLTLPGSPAQPTFPLLMLFRRAMGAAPLTLSSPKFSAPLPLSPPR